MISIGTSLAKSHLSTTNLWRKSTSYHSYPWCHSLRFWLQTTQTEKCLYAKTAYSCTRYTKMIKSIFEKQLHFVFEALIARNKLNMYKSMNLSIQNVLIRERKENCHWDGISHSLFLQAFTLEDELPDYDADDEDEKWLEGFNKKNPDKAVDVLTFERIIDTLEKSCSSRIDVSTMLFFFIFLKVFYFLFLSYNHWISSISKPKLFHSF